MSPSFDHRNLSKHLCSSETQTCKTWIQCLLSLPLVLDQTLSEQQLTDLSNQDHQFFVDCSANQTPLKFSQVCWDLQYIIHKLLIIFKELLIFINRLFKLFALFSTIVLLFGIIKARFLKGRGSW